MTRERISPTDGAAILARVADAAQSAAAKHPNIEVRFKNGALTTRRRYEGAISLELLTTSQLAEKLGAKEQDIINLVNRFDIVCPEKSTDFSSHETYVFTPEEAKLVAAVFRIQRELFFSLSEAVEAVVKRDQNLLAAQKLQAALRQFDGTPSSRLAIVEVLSLVPTLTDQELQVFLLIEAQKLTLAQAGEKLGVASEAKVRNILNSTKEKVGKAFFYLRKLSTILQ